MLVFVKCWTRKRHSRRSALPWCSAWYHFSRSQSLLLKWSPFFWVLPDNFYHPTRKKKVLQFLCLEKITPFTTFSSIYGLTFSFTFVRLFFWRDAYSFCLLFYHPTLSIPIRLSPPPSPETVHVKVINHSQWLLPSSSVPFPLSGDQHGWFLSVEW